VVLDHQGRAATSANTDTFTASGPGIRALGAGVQLTVPPGSAHAHQPRLHPLAHIDIPYREGRWRRGRPASGPLWSAAAHLGDPCAGCDSSRAALQHRDVFWFDAMWSWGPGCGVVEVHRMSEWRGASAGTDRRAPTTLDRRADSLFNQRRPASELSPPRSTDA